MQLYCLGMFITSVILQQEGFDYCDFTFWCPSAMFFKGLINKCNYSDSFDNCISKIYLSTPLSNREASSKVVKRSN